MVGAADGWADLPPAGDAGSTRLIYGPTGRVLEPGRGHMTVFGLFSVPTLHVGVTPRFQVGFGAPFYRSGLLAPKVQLLQRGRTSVAAGVVHVWIPGADGSGGYAYVAATYGERDGAVTVVGGRFYSTAREPGAYVVSIGGERRLSPKVVWITENHVTRGGVFTSGGFRRHGPRRYVDFIMGWVISEHGVAPVPMLNAGWWF
jgi:hypothetical protein